MKCPASLIICCIGYSTPPIAGVPYDERGGKFRQRGRPHRRPALRVGWARRGPTGTIGTNRPDGYEVAEADRRRDAARAASATGPAATGSKACSTSAASWPTDYDDWRKIEAAEEAAARPGSPREKMVRVEQWLRTLGR